MRSRLAFSSPVHEKAVALLACRRTEWLVALAGRTQADDTARPLSPEASAFD
jgi:hypothetical protein